VVHAKRYADRVHQVGLPMHRLSTFAYSLRTQAWLEAVNTESSSRDAAFEVLMLAAQVLNEYEASGVVTSIEEVRLAADLESALINAYKTIQVVCSARSNARIDQAFIKLEEARPWWWFNSARGERDAGRVAVPVQRDRELADLLSGTRLDEFIGEATKGLSAEDRAGYLRQTGLSIVKPQYEDLIPESNRVWDASMLIIDEPIDAKPHTRNFRGGR
jgi:hypothetical protein